MLNSQLSMKKFYNLGACFDFPPYLNFLIFGAHGFTSYLYMPFQLLGQLYAYVTQRAADARGLGIIRGKKVGESE